MNVLRKSESIDFRNLRFVGQNLVVMERGIFICSLFIVLHGNVWDCGEGYYLL